MIYLGFEEIYNFMIDLGFEEFMIYLGFGKLYDFMFSLGFEEFYGFVIERFMILLLKSFNVLF